MVGGVGGARRSRGKHAPPLPAAPPWGSEPIDCRYSDRPGAPRRTCFFFALRRQEKHDTIRKNAAICEK